MSSVLRQSLVVAASIVLSFTCLASVLIDDGGGQFTWLEDFSDPGTVDASGGPGPGLDATEIVGASLRQRLGGAGEVVIDFLDPSSFAYDPQSIELSDDGYAALGSGGDPGFPFAYWRMEDAAWNGSTGEVSSWASVNYTGTSVGAQLLAGGFIDQGASFDGASYLNFGQQPELDFDPASDDLTLAAWFRTTSDGALMGKAVNSAGSRQVYLFLLGGRLSANLGGAQHSGATSGLTDGQWHHGAVVNFDDAGSRRFALYVDGVLDGTFTSGSATNGADFLVGGRRQNGNTGLGFTFSGDIDEVMVWDRALAAGDVAALYNQGAGQILQPYDSTGPSIVDTVGHHIPGLVAFTGFTEIASGPGQVAHRLSTDGLDWQFFDGAVWRASTVATERNDAATIDANIASFDTGAERIYVESFLLSDGDQYVQLSGLRIGFTAQTAAQSAEILGPVEAGSWVSMSATVSGEDADHSVRFQVLGADSAAVSDLELPGNGAGFSAAEAAAGIDLSALTAPEIYLRLDFLNGLGDLQSAAVDELRIAHTPPVSTDLRVSMSAPAGPVGEDEPFDFVVQVENLGPGTAEDVRLEISLPSALDADNAFPSAAGGWQCLSRDEAEQLYTGLAGVDFLCLHSALPSGASDQIFVPRRLRAPFSGFSPLVATATVSSPNDVEPVNDSASSSVGVNATAQALFSIQKTAEPADGTDFDFLFDGATPFQLDARDSFDGDEVYDSQEFWVSPGLHSAEELNPPPTWVLDWISCETSAPFDTVLDLALEPASWAYDSSAITLDGGSAILLDDVLRPGLVGYWRFEEGTWTTESTIVDHSGFGHHGSSSQFDNPFIVQGRLGDGGKFGGGTHVDFDQPSALDFDPAADAFTVGAWFRTSGDGAIVGKAVASLAQRQFYLFVYQGRLWANIGGEQNGAAAQVADDQWHHALVVNEDSGGTMIYTLYVDGQAAGSWPSGSATNGADLLVGARRNNDNADWAFGLDGVVDEVTMWNRALGGAEVAGLYAGGAGRVIGGDFPTDRPSLTLLAAADSQVTAWAGVAETTSAASTGHLLYQVATTAGSFMYWDGGSWATALGDGDANDVQTLNQHLGELAVAPQGELWLRVLFASDGSQPVVLEGLRLAYTANPPPQPVISERRVELDLRLGQPVSCVFHNITPVLASTLTFHQQTTPSDGTDIPYGSQALGGFTLDDAQPDDGDGVSSSHTFTDVAAATYAVQPFTPAGWTLDGFACEVVSEGVPLTFVADYAGPGAYVFDPQVIEVDSGARLRDSLPGLEAYWRLEQTDFEGDPASVLDAAGGGHVGTPFGDAEADYDTAFFGGNGYVSFGQPAGLDFDPASDAFTISLWFRTLGDGALLGKAVGGLTERQYYLFVWQGRLWANLGGEQNGSVSTGLDDGTWHHAAVVNYQAAGVARHALYLDGQPEGDWVSGSATNGADLLLGARRASGNTGLAFALEGHLDEIRIYGRDLSAGEVADLEALGREALVGSRFDPSGPAVTSPAIGEGASSRAVGFTAALEAGSSGQVGFQLSGDGLVWRFWNGATWTAASPGQHNDAATVDQHIPSFPAAAGWIWVRAFLLSDGSQPAGLDRVEIEVRGEVDHFATLDRAGALDHTPVGWIRYDLGRELECSFEHRQVPPAASTVHLHLDTEPADGTDVVIQDLSTGSGVDYTLDDAMPDDGDGVTGSVSLVVPSGQGEVRLYVHDANGLRPVSFLCTAGMVYSTLDQVHLEIEDGQQVDCTLRLAAGPDSDLEQLTDESSGVDTTWVTASHDGSVVAWASTGGPGGQDPEGDYHVFVRDGGVVRQITSGSGSAQELALSGDGSYLTFTMDWDPVGSNPDGSLEVFRVDLNDDSVTQVTDTGGCSIYSLSADDAGRVAFNADCTTSGGQVLNADGSPEIFVWDGGQLLATDFDNSCVNFQPSLARGGQLPLLTFASTCDPVGLNSEPDHSQVFVWSWTDSQVPYRQLSRSPLTEPAMSIQGGPAISGDGRYIAVVSNQDPAAASPVAYTRVSRIDRETGEILSVKRLSPFHFVEGLSISSDGRFVVGQLYDWLTDQGPRAVMVWDFGLGDDPTFRGQLSVSGSILPPAITQDPSTGRLRLFFESGDDYEGLNPEQNREAWSLLLED